MLVADDDPASRRLVAAVATAQGFQVVTVHDGREAIRLWSSDNFALLVTDYMMPGSTGLEVLQHIRDAGNGTPAILMSGTLDGPSIRLSQTLGSVLCLPKPFGVFELRAAIGHAVLNSNLAAPRTTSLRVRKPRGLPTLQAELGNVGSGVRRGGALQLDGRGHSAAGSVEVSIRC